MERERPEATRIRDSAAELRTLSEMSTSGIIRTDPQGRCEYVNASWCQQAGLSVAEALGDGWHSAIHPEDRQRVVEAWNWAIAAGGHFQECFRILRPSGEVRWIRGGAAPVVDRDGVSIGYLGINDDETESRLREEKLAEANRVMRERVMDAEARNRDLVLLHEMNDLLQSSLNDNDANEVVAQYFPDIFPNSQGAIYLLSAERTLVELSAGWGERSLEAAFTPASCWALRRSGVHCPRGVGLRCSHLRGEASHHVCLPMLAQGETVGVIVLCHPDRNELVRSMDLAKAAADQVALALANMKLRESLRSQSIRDPLTGLFNRRYMDETFERELARVKRHKQPLSVLMMDLDHFKSFNDSFGHAAADEVLRKFGALLAKSFRQEDIACRIGGEEFVVILPGAAAVETQKRAELVRASMRELSLLYKGNSIGTATVSIGVAEAFVDGDTPDDILRSADEALFRAKQSGRDRVVRASLLPSERSLSVAT